ncbi:transposase [Saccharolobus shibatae]|uniref:Transposase InsH N-terminal domain-containing protein n=1 Tax=Saccharolobus shibatae TaxID=2286 RepID=A0A8F5BYC4_9CREN|nr:transposase [Saccharolobus shibatae]QXJ30601.1 hypothetical protein J5U21_00247 [Saccharolobus shibatae]QXJ33635.1 hypothetical protein J5U22_00177 [Saccharolobus shibatae]
MSKLRSLYSKKPKWDVILLLKTLLIKFIYDISWNNLEGEIRYSKMFMDFLDGKFHPRVFFFYKRLQQTVVDEGETMRTTLMDELNKALDKVIKEYRENGFELEVGREKTIGSRTTT